ncbi:serine carboxypeptidase domain-containing protein [Ditylenchus destructor]|uniref:Carboxypeptidase n=1 Tax=Ditylenchus destructor TaxID=166010 RepID=A0AAD4MJP7_9BILA|nr:serine carboxypeptidase domain-containing protein [Ditylenchus destructor]
MLSRRILLYFALLVIAFPAILSQSAKENDRIRNLPGLNFKYAAKQYSGYFKLPSQNNLHYWLLESQGNASTDPLIYWMCGGPGCSGMYSIFTEWGPFFPNPDGKTLFENIFAWNKVANILVFDNPRGVGYSYNDLNSTNLPFNDDSATTDNADGLKQFLVRYPEYSGRDFYLMGHSYGGLWTVALTKRILPMIMAQPKELNLNLLGLAVGNAFLSLNHLANSYVNMAMYRGVIGIEDMNFLNDNCCPDNAPVQNCNFSDYLTHDSQLNFRAKTYSDPVKQQCANLILGIANGQFTTGIPGYFKFYVDLDCYVPYDELGTSRKDLLKDARYREAMDLLKGEQTPILDEHKLFVDQGSLVNRKSTDQFGGKLCYVEGASEAYLNRSDVRRALHIPHVLDSKNFLLCEYIPATRNYTSQYFENAEIFQWMFNTGYPLKVLVYNGDADGICNHLSAATFVHSLGMEQLLDGKRVDWKYHKENYVPTTLGFVEKFRKGNVTLDLLTLIGGAHIVPRNLPGPGLQMIANFLSENRNYSQALPFDPAAQKAEVKNPVPPTKVSKSDHDKIWDLPGLTFDYKFDQYSGYLSGNATGNYLFYWLLEPQNNRKKAPVVLWLSGGPGCSGLGSLISEHGPFRVNPDGSTLWENVFSWNKAAYVIYLDSPRGTGFSYQNMTENPSQEWSDDLTPKDTLVALKQLYEAYDFLAGRDLYISGESYGGVYVPTLVSHIIKELEKESNGIYAGLGVNLKGMAIGNGVFSAKWSGASLYDYLYFHGLIQKSEWDEIRKCCDPPNEVYCNIPSTANCPALANNSLNGFTANPAVYLWGSALFRIDFYNLYQHCYEMDRIPNGLFDQGTSNSHALPYSSTKNLGLDEQINFNYASNDASFTFPCYALPYKANAYFNRECVREALHVPEYVQQWSFCNQTINSRYDPSYFIGIKDMKTVFSEILNSSYVRETMNEAFHILLYNGDADFLGSFLSAELFVKDLVASSGSGRRTSNKQPWYYKSTSDTTGLYNGIPAGGFLKTYDFGHSSNDSFAQLDLLTVKGAGHFAPLDRPGPSLQMLYNFVNDIRDYSTKHPYSVKPKPLKEQYKDA